MERDLRKLLAFYGTSFKKAFGQNFLSDADLLDDIAKNAGVSKDDTVIEIGCGAGTLTRALAARAKRVIGYEIDLSLKPILTEMLRDLDNVKIVYKDVMKESVAAVEKEAGGDYKIVANLPYYITTPVVMKFLENSDKLVSMTVMVQEEVAERFAAQAGTSDYGAITVGINLRGAAEIVKKVPREKFTPAPNVDSAVVRIDLERNKYAGVDLAEVREAVKAGFLNRRKMLVNNLMQYYKINREAAERVLTSANVSLTARGETLTEKEFIAIAEGVKNEKSK